jgi:hypothetical protein
MEKLLKRHEERYQKWVYIYADSTAQRPNAKWTRLKEKKKTPRNKMRKQYNLSNIIIDSKVKLSP